MEIIDINFREENLSDEKKKKKKKKKKNENILIYDISYKTTFMRSIPLRISFDKIDVFIKIYDRIRYLVLFCYLYDEICNNIKYLVREKKWYYRYY